MSHFSTMKIKFRSILTLKEALEKLASKYGYEIKENVEIRGYSGMRKEAEIGLIFERGKYDIGFKISKGELEMIADWYEGGDLGNFDRQSFLQDVNALYIEAELKLLENEGYVLVGRVENPLHKGVIEYSYNKMVIDDDGNSHNHNIYISVDTVSGKVKYECSGYQGEACLSVLDLMKRIAEIEAIDYDTCVSEEAKEGKIRLGGWCG